MVKRDGQRLQTVQTAILDRRTFNHDMRCGKGDVGDMARAAFDLAGWRRGVVFWGAVLWISSRPQIQATRTVSDTTTIVRLHDRANAKVLVLDIVLDCC